MILLLLAPTLHKLVERRSEEEELALQTQEYEKSVWRIWTSRQSLYKIAYYFLGQ